MNLAAAGSSAPTLTLPIERGGEVRARARGHLLRSGSGEGRARHVVEARGGGASTGPDVEPDNFGSTFWPSPQSAWDWPPPAEIGRSPYDGGLRGATVTLKSQTFALGLRGDDIVHAPIR